MKLLRPMFFILGATLASSNTFAKGGFAMSSWDGESFIKVADPPILTTSNMTGTISISVLNILNTRSFYSQSGRAISVTLAGYQMMKIITTPSPKRRCSF